MATAFRKQKCSSRVHLPSWTRSTLISSSFESPDSDMRSSQQTEFLRSWLISLVKFYSACVNSTEKATPPLLSASFHLLSSSTQRRQWSTVIGVVDIRHTSVYRWGVPRCWGIKMMCQKRLLLCVIRRWMNLFSVLSIPEKTSKPVPSFTEKNFNVEKSGNIPLPRPDFSVTLHILCPIVRYEVLHFALVMNGRRCCIWKRHFHNILRGTLEFHRTCADHVDSRMIRPGYAGKSIPMEYCSLLNFRKRTVDSSPCND